MRRPAILQSLKARLRPFWWTLFAALFMLLHLVRMLLGGGRPAPSDILHFTEIFLVVIGLVAVTPIPWQWTGDGRRMAPAFRGFLQALVFNGAWLAAWLAWRPFNLHQSPPVTLLVVALVVGWTAAKLQAAEGDRAEAQAARLELEETARKAQEQALVAQLDPHVLYNALGGISELIQEDPARAEAAVISLAELYRKLTALGRRGTVSLQEERNLVEEYLAVEGMRLGKRLRVRWDWPELLDLREVPPLLVLPLVENAIKHGLGPHKGGGELRIRAAAEGPGLCFTVADNGVPLDPSWQHGTGLSNLAARLALLGGGSRLELRQAEAWTLAELWLWPEGRP